MGVWNSNFAAENRNAHGNEEKSEIIKAVPLQELHLAGKHYRTRSYFTRSDRREMGARFC